MVYPCFISSNDSFQKGRVSLVMFQKLSAAATSFSLVVLCQLSGVPSGHTFLNTQGTPQSPTFDTNKTNSLPSPSYFLWTAYIHCSFLAVHTLPYLFHKNFQILSQISVTQRFFTSPAHLRAARKWGPILQQTFSGGKF